MPKHQIFCELCRNRLSGRSRTEAATHVFEFDTTHEIPYQCVVQSACQLTQGQATGTETDLLAQSGFSAEEIVALLWLRQWYQTGGSDRVHMVRHLEFLRLLVKSGDLEL